MENSSTRVGRAPARVLAAALVGLVLLAAPPARAAVSAGLPDFTQLVKDNAPAVVNISTSMVQKGASVDDEHGGGPGPGYTIPNLPEDSPLNDFFKKFFGEQGPDGPGGPGAPGPRSSLGSGFIVSKDGYVITNNHVVKDADQISVRLSDRRELSAKLVGSDPRSDIAVLKLEADGDLPVLKLGTSSALEVGEWVLAIGSPFGFDHSATAGIVSAKGRSLPNENYVPFIQTDVAINPGNSGGPLFNLKGEVVGVNSQIYSRTGGFMGVSFAIPIDVVMNVYRQLRDKGAVSRGWLGVLIQDVTKELADSFHMQKPQGALVSKVLPDSPAAKSGIAAGDVITKFNGREIDTSADLPPIVGGTSVGDKIPVELLREGKRKDVTITIGELPNEDEAATTKPHQPKDQARFNDRLKVSVRELTAQERKEFGVSGAGVMVTRVKPGPAFDAGLQDGDIILQIDFREIANAAELERASAELKPGTSIPILVQRQGNPLFMPLKVPAK
ncbi:MAG: DegQ family serine endoprotease [Gammaproteobacteria bacterium]|nr:DegQ family serine endoprotease [Gammaproteobacteria bacterium]